MTDIDRIARHLRDAAVSGLTIEIDVSREVAEAIARQIEAVAPAPAHRLPGRADILDAARQAVTVDRARDHGEAEHSFALIAARWNAHLGGFLARPLTAADVAVMMIDLKLARIAGNPGHADSWVDVAGYAACGGEIATGGGRRGD